MSTLTSTASVAKIYDSIADKENARLQTHPMEREITLRTIRWHLTGSSARRNTESTSTTATSESKLTIADIGGGPGKLSFALADEGHSVDLVDLSPELIKLAELEQERRRSLQRQGQEQQQEKKKDDDDVAETPALLSSIAVGNALETKHLPSLSGREGAYDAVLLLGPLYHLLDEGERRAAFGNALELARPGGGLVFVAFISVEAHLRDLAVRDPGRLLMEKGFYDGYLSTGHYTRLNPATNNQAQSFHTNSDYIRDFFSQHFADSAELIDLRSTEAILGGGLDSALVDAPSEVMEAWADLMFERYSGEERHFGCADHLLAVLRRK